MMKDKIQTIIFAFLTAVALTAFQGREVSAQTQDCSAVTCTAEGVCDSVCGTCWVCNTTTNLCEPDSLFCDGFSGGLEENICRTAECVQGSPENPTGCEYFIDLTATEPECILCEEPRPIDQPTCGNGACEPEIGENCENCAVDCLVPGFDEACPRGGPIPPAQLCIGPSLGAAETFGILASTYTNNAGTTIDGDLGYTTLAGPAPTVTGDTHVANATYSAAGTDQGVALIALNSQACTFNFAAGAVDLATDTTHGPIGFYTPGVYCITGAASIGTAGITLGGSGTYIFRMDGALTSVTGSSVTLTDDASACNVWWTPTQAATLAANSTFTGTIIADSGITIGDTVSWLGRALAFGGTVTTTNDTITIPTGTEPPPTPIVCDSPPMIAFPGPPFTAPGDGACEDGDVCTQSACDQETGLCEAQTLITACSGGVSDLCCPAFCFPFDADDPACDDDPTLCDIDCIPELYCPFCGNNIIDPGEECDGTAPNNCGPTGCNDATCQCNPPVLGQACIEGSGFNNNSGKAPGDCGGWSCSLGKGASTPGFMLPLLSAILLVTLLVQRRQKHHR